MAREYNAKVITGDGTILVDLTDSDISAARALRGTKYYNAKGQPEDGTCDYDVDSSSVTATPDDVPNGITFAAQGEVKTGRLPIRGAQESTISDADDSVTILQGLHDGSGKVTLDATEKAKLKNHMNIRAGVTILGETGEYSGESAELESKTVDAKFTDETYLPSSGKDGFSQFTVNAIKITRTTAPNGGSVVTIG